MKEQLPEAALNLPLLAVRVGEWLRMGLDVDKVLRFQALQPRLRQHFRSLTRRVSPKGGPKPHVSGDRRRTTIDYVISSGVRPDVEDDLVVQGTGLGNPARGESFGGAEVLGVVRWIAASLPACIGCIQNNAERKCAR